MNNTNPLPLPDDSMPPIPGVGEYGPQVCSTVRLYLAILDDLPPEQVQLLLEHVRGCAGCARVHRLMQQTTRVFADLPASAPSSRVDQAVMAAIAAQGNRQVPANATSDEGEREGRSYNTRTPSYIPRTSKRSRGMVGAPLAAALVGGTLKSRAVKTVVPVALVAMLLLAFLTTTHFLGSSTTQAFRLPSNLSWSGYVLYHSETRIDAQGARYHVNCYHDLSTDRLHVETVMPGQMDVVAVGNDHAMLGLDMMHHVAQWGANAWSVDETAFNLAELRGDIDAHRAVYLDQDVFRGQPVYRIRARNGLVLLLDMHYRPVNVLRGAIGPGTGGPIYDVLVLMPASHVSHSMWDMSVPAGFQMGTLPKKP